MLLREDIPSLKYGAKVLISEILGLVSSVFGDTLYVDGDSGSDSNSGTSPTNAFKTIQAAVTASAKWGTVVVKALDMSATTTDPGSYAENVVIPAGKCGLRIVGDNAHNRTQGGLPQLKVGSTTTQALITVRSAACSIIGMGINGAGATGGGILLDDDGGTSKTAFGTSIIGNHFKNCVGTTATNAATGGAIMWSSAGNAWQVLIRGNRFYKNVGDIVLLGTSGSVPQDVVVEDNVFSGPAASVDCHIYSGGSGFNGVIIRNNSFPCFPAIGSGTNAKSLRLTGSVGELSGNKFGSSAKTFGAAGHNLVPTTVLMSDNYQEPAAGASGEIGRT